MTILTIRSDFKRVLYHIIFSFVYTIYDKLDLFLSSGEIESKLRKNTNETNGQNPRINSGTKHDGILKICMNASDMEIGFLEVVGIQWLKNCLKVCNVRYSYLGIGSLFLYRCIYRSLSTSAPPNTWRSTSMHSKLWTVRSVYLLI